MIKSLNHVTGKISLVGTDIPIPTLSVAVITVDKFKVIPNNFPNQIQGDTSIKRILLKEGITQADGSFQLSFVDLPLPDFFNDDFIPNPSLTDRKWYNIYVMVSYMGVALFTSEVKDQATRREDYQIVIHKIVFERNGVPLQVVYSEAATLKKNIESEFEKQKELSQVKEVLKKEVEEERGYEKEMEKQFLKPFCNALSNVPDRIRNNKNIFVEEGESVEAVTKKNIIQKILSDFNNTSDGSRFKSTGMIALNEEQQKELFKSEFKQADGSYELPKDISKAVYEGLIKNNSLGEGDTTELIFKSPLHKYCSPGSSHQKECMTVLGMSMPPKNGETETKSNNNITINTTDEDNGLNEQIKIQMKDANSPESPVKFGVNARATLAEIEQNVKNLSMRPSPADVPAYFDFHSIQIAFEHVWQEAIDEGVLDLAKDAYDQIVNLGGEPPIAKNDRIPFQALKKESKLITKRVPLKKKDLFVPKEVTDVFPKATDVWSRLTFNDKKTLSDRAKNIQALEKQNYFGSNRGYNLAVSKKYRKEGNDIIQKARPRPKARIGKAWSISRLKPVIYNIQARTENIDEIVNELEEQLKAKSYSFTTYAANEKERSINFGILTTYRQKWEPVSYQVGELVKSIPLAPKEIRRYSKKVVVKRNRIEKEIENNLRITKTDSAESNRAESEIVDKATNKTSFARNSSVTGSANFGIGEGSSTQTVNFTGDASKESRNLKKSFRENVFKAAQEYKNERKIEITSEENFESEYNESGEISNPNDELTVTYLFYELQRRYKIQERIHRLCPVIFVAQEMPKPSEIDEDWLLTYDWIIRRILLDDSFLPALNYLGNITADEFVLEELEKDVEEQRHLVKDLRITLTTIKQEVENRFLSLQQMIDNQAKEVEGKDWYDGIPVLGTIGNAREKILDGIGGLFGFGGSGDDEIEAARLRASSARNIYEEASQHQKEMMARLVGENNKLQDISNRYNNKLSEKLQKDLQIVRLKVHVKQNILHYMHGIWSHEHPDQRFFRLHSVQVPTLKGDMKLKIVPTPLDLSVQSAYHPEKSFFAYQMKPNIKNEFTTLEQVADLDNLIGYKGNYMIFGLKENNILTDYMMAPYVDQELGLKDPDEFGNWTLDEFSEYVCCLKKELSTQDFDSLIPSLTASYKKILMDPLRQGEEIVVPTGTLYVEALSGTHSLLEDFKLIHRAIDIKKVQAEVRGMELENIRLAARLQAGELDDPDVEKRIIVNGNGRVDLIGSEISKEK